MRELMLNQSMKLSALGWEAVVPGSEMGLVIGLQVIRVAGSANAPGVIRTPGQRFRKPLLYPPELQGQADGAGRQLA
jgi:hypothetical protein